jgi:hypothetical protein
MNRDIMVSLRGVAMAARYNSPNGKANGAARIFKVVIAKTLRVDDVGDFRSVYGKPFSDFVILSFFVSSVMMRFKCKALAFDGTSGVVDPRCSAAKISKRILNLNSANENT